MTNQMLLKGIMDNQSAVYLKEQQISSGKSIQSASDDPTAWSRIHQLNQDLEQLDQFSDNSDLINFRLEMADQTLSSIGDVLQRASELSVEASNGTLSEGDREVLALQADALLEQLVALANSPSDDGYQFGGVLSANEPFAVTRDADDRIDSVSYVGGTFSASLEIAEGDALSGLLVGGDSDSGLFISDASDAFAPLIELRDLLLAGENLADSGVQEQIDAAFDRSLIGRASIGAHLEHLEFVDGLRAEQELLLTENLSELEDIDMAEAVTELSEKQLAYEAALAMTSQAMNVSLLNYL
jgi:flagellar hook-associated protein 3 FlgL